MQFLGFVDSIFMRGVDSCLNHSSQTGNGLLVLITLLYITWSRWIAEFGYQKHIQIAQTRQVYFGLDIFDFGVAAEK